MADTRYTVDSGFYDSVNQDRLYSADEMNMPYKDIISEGVFEASGAYAEAERAAAEILRLVREEVATPRSRLMSALIASPMRAGELADKLGMDPVEIMRILSDYEIAGVVKHLPDGRYAPTQEVLLGQGRMEVYHVARRGYS